MKLSGGMVALTINIQENLTGIAKQSLVHKQTIVDKHRISNMYPRLVHKNDQKKLQCTFKWSKYIGLISERPNRSGMMRSKGFHSLVDIPLECIAAPPWLVKDKFSFEVVPSSESKSLSTPK